MARPIKQGLDYFALDVKMDDETELIEAEHGHLGFFILIKMFQKIYSNGYFLKWDEKQQLLFSRSVSVDRNEVTYIISDCIKWEIFDSEMYEKQGILTSRRIQRHYSKAVYKRVGVQMRSEFLLVDVSDSKNIEVTGVSDIGNEDASIVSDGESTQSKVKESKVKESKVNKDNKPANRKQVYDDSSPFLKLANLLYEKILVNDANYKKPNLQNWADHIRLMVERDNRTLEQIEYVISWVQDNSFWKSNVLSTRKLREKFSQLVIQIKEEKAKEKKQQQKRNNIQVMDAPKWLGNEAEWNKESEDPEEYEQAQKKIDELMKKLEVDEAASTG